MVPPAGYDPAPPRTGVAVADDDVTGQDFALTRPGALGGQVTDSGDGAAVPGVGITVLGPDGPVTLTTDAQGNYFLDDLPAGDYTITATAPAGYEIVGAPTRSITITGAGEVRGAEDFQVREVPVTPTPTPTTTPTNPPTIAPTVPPTPTQSPTQSPTSTPSTPTPTHGTPTNHANDQPTDQVLPDTGFGSMVPLYASILLVAGGIVLLLLGRRRRSG